MQFQPYFLLSDTHLLFLRKRFSSALEAWHSRWLKPGVRYFSSDFELEADGRFLASEEECWVYANLDRTFASLELSPACSFQSVLENLISYDPVRSNRLPQASSVAVEVVQDVLGDLIDGFLMKHDNASVLAWRRLASGSSGIDDGSRGGISLRLEGPGADLRLRFPAESVKEMLPKPAHRPGRALTPLVQAASSASMTVRVILEASEGLALEALENLAAGDIVLLDRNSSDTWLLAGPGDVRLAACAPGRSGQRYAIQILDRDSSS